VADLVALEDMATDGAPAFRGEPKELYARAVELWQAGDLKGSLAHFFALRGLEAESEPAREMRRNAALGLAIAARDLGKLRLAKTLLDEVLLDDPPPRSLTRAFVLAAAVWQGLGSIPAAFAFLREARRLLPPKDSELAAFVAHQEAKLFLAAGSPREARKALDEAVACYRKRKDTYGETRAALLSTRIDEAGGAMPRILASAAAAAALAHRHDHDKLLLTARLEHGRLLLKAGREKEAEPILCGALGDAIRLQDRKARFLAHVHLWKTYGRLGDQVRARIELIGAQALVRHVDDKSPEAEEVRRLHVKGGLA
jgi:tetratricopeptide (TPR) repeat protein